MPYLWNQDVQDREELEQILQISEVVFKRLGIFIRFTQPFYIALYKLTEPPEPMVDNSRNVEYIKLKKCEYHI